jgi:hypothetical protein
MAELRLATHCFGTTLTNCPDSFIQLAHAPKQKNMIIIMKISEK